MPVVTETPAIEQQSGPAVSKLLEAIAERRSALQERVTDGSEVRRASSRPIGEEEARNPRTSPSREPAAPAMEGTLAEQTGRSARQGRRSPEAQLRATAALYEGLSAAYDFALDAEDQPGGISAAGRGAGSEDPASLADGAGRQAGVRRHVRRCDHQAARSGPGLGAQNELPRGSLAERIEAEGGLGLDPERDAEAACDQRGGVRPPQQC